MSLNGILAAEMTVRQMKVLAGKARSKGAATKHDATLAVLCALADRGRALSGDEEGRLAKVLEVLPAAAQRKIRASPPAQRELARVECAASACTHWRELSRVLERYPPSVFLSIVLRHAKSAQKSDLEQRLKKANYLPLAAEAIYLNEILADSLRDGRTTDLDEQEDKKAFALAYALAKGRRPEIPAPASDASGSEPARV